MLSLYHKIWVDAILAEKGRKTERKNWKLYTIIPVSVLQGINLFTLFYRMKGLFNRQLPLFIPVDIFSYHALNSFISILATYFVPFVILNYLFIFNNDRYTVLLQKYTSVDGLYKRYALISIGLIAIPLLISILFF